MGQFLGKAHCHSWLSLSCLALGQARPLYHFHSHPDKLSDLWENEKKFLLKAIDLLPSLQVP